MEFIQARCPQCNADLDFPEDKEFFDCQYCGATIVVKDVLEQRKYVSNWMRIADSALKADNIREAYSYYNKVLEVDSSNHLAWFGKASSCKNVSEMISYFENAVNFSPEKQKTETSKKAAKYLYFTALESTDVIKRNRFDTQKEVIMMLEAAHNFDPEDINILRTLIEKIITSPYGYRDEEIAVYEDKLKKLDPAYQTRAEKEAADSNLQEAIDGESAEELSDENRNKKTIRRNNIILAIVILTIMAILYYFAWMPSGKPEIKTETANKETQTVKEEDPIDKYGYAVIEKYAAKNFYVVSIVIKSPIESEIKRITKELYGSYKSESKKIYFNYYNNRDMAYIYRRLQDIQDKESILGNPGNYGLKAIAECDTKTGKIKYLINENNRLIKMQ